MYQNKDKLKILFETLLTAIRDRKLLSYTEVAGDVVIARIVSKFLDEINWKIKQVDADAPTISAIVVSRVKGIPGDGISQFPDFYGYDAERDIEKKMAIAKKVQEKVFDYPWHNIKERVFD